MARISDDLPVDAGIEEMSGLGALAGKILRQEAHEGAKDAIRAARANLIKEEAQAAGIIRQRVAAAAAKLQEKLQKRLARIPERVELVTREALNKIREKLVAIIKRANMSGFGVPPFQHPIYYAPEQQDILGLEQGVFMPGVERPDYAVNPLSGLGSRMMMPGAEGAPQSHENMFGLGEDKDDEDVDGIGEEGEGVF